MGVKFRAEKDDLIKLISPAAAGASNKTTLPALEGILFTLQGDELTLCGYDLERGIQVKGEVIGENDGSVILNAQKINGIIKALPDGEVLFVCDDKNSVTVRCGMSEYVMHGSSAEMFPNLPEFSGDVSFEIKGSVIKRIVNGTYFAISQTDKRPVLMGQRFIIKDKSVSVTALDNFRIAMWTEDNAVETSDGEMEFIIPGKSLLEFSRLITDAEEEIHVEKTMKHIIFFTGNMIFFSRLTDGPYLSFERQIRSESKINVKVSKSSLIDSIERVSLFVDEKNKTPIQCTFTENILNIFCFNQFGRVNDSVVVEKSGPDLEIWFNYKYILEALRACTEENVVLELNSDMQALQIQNASESEKRFFHLILPMKIKRE
jgi:DNA polymerase-3 subunit beta